MAPAYFIYLLRVYCFPSSSKYSRAIPFKESIKRIMKLGLIVTSVFLITFGPFYDHIGQVLSRLFPFKRGLCHAYWAPNAWALYNMADKGFSIAGNYIISYFVVY